MKMKTACSVHLFQKSLLLSTKGKAGTSTGQIVNIMSNDADQLFRFTTFAAQVVIICPPNSSFNSYLY